MADGTKEELRQWEFEQMKEVLRKIEAIANQPTYPIPEGDSLEGRLHRIWMLAHHG